MKNLIKFFIICVLALSSVNQSFSSFGMSHDGNGFYSTVSKNYSELNSSLYKLELENNKDKINGINGNNCLKRNLTEDEIKRIVYGEDKSLVELIEAFDDSCIVKGENGGVPINLVNDVYAGIIEYHEKTTERTNEKSKTNMNFANLGIYTNGNTNDGPFDIMEDIEKIDKIVFEFENSDSFQAEETISLADKIKDLLGKSDDKNNETSGNQVNDNNNISGTGSQDNGNSGQNSGNSATSGGNNSTNLCKLNGNCNNYTQVQQILCEYNGNCNGEETKGFISTQNEAICYENTSGLTDSTINLISKNINGNNSSSGNSGFYGNWDLSNLDPTHNWTTSGYTGTSGNQNGNGEIIPIPFGDYTKVDDNNVWNCNDFFCIEVEFKTISHNLLGNGSQNPSIEFLVNRSNNHLKKFANGTSLAQSKMTLNNFELGLKDLNLSKAFYENFVITKKPVPGLSLEKDFSKQNESASDEAERKKEDGKNEAKKQLDDYMNQLYTAYNLNPENPNDLASFKDNEMKRVAATEGNNSVSVLKMGKDLQDLAAIREGLIKNTEELTKITEQKVRTEKVSDLESQMKEIEGFTSTLNNYIQNLDAILKKMLEIPQDKSTS